MGEPFTDPLIASSSALVKVIRGFLYSFIANPPFRHLGPFGHPVKQSRRIQTYLARTRRKDGVESGRYEMMSLPEAMQKTVLSHLPEIPRREARKKRLGEKRSRNEKRKNLYELQSVLPSSIWQVHMRHQRHHLQLPLFLQLLHSKSGCLALALSTSQVVPPVYQAHTPTHRPHDNNVVIHLPTRVCISAVRCNTYHFVTFTMS